MTHLSPVPNDPNSFEDWLDTLPPDQAREVAHQLEQAGALDSPGQFSPGGMPRPNAPIALPDPPARSVRMVCTVSLDGAEPQVWRRISVPGEVSLHTFHDVLQAAMGWTDSHLHRFWASTDMHGDHFVTEFDQYEGDDGTLEEHARLDQLLSTPGDAFAYLYDFGDDWLHHVELVQSTPRSQNSADSEDTSMVCIDGAGACPPEDSGGIGIYNALAAWFDDGMPPGGLDAFGLDERTMRYWLPEGFDPYAFDPGRASATLAAVNRPPASHSLPMPGELAQLVNELPYSAQLVVDGWLHDEVWQQPVDVDAETAAGMVRPWLMALEVIGDGVDLTKAGWLKPVYVERIFAGLNTEWIGKGNREDLTPPVAYLRQQCQDLGLLTKRKGRLSATARARKLARDPRSMVAHIASRLPAGRSDFERQCGWLSLVAYGSGIGMEISSGTAAQLATLMASLGWHTQRGPVTAPIVRDGVRPTLSVLENVAPHTSTDTLHWTPERGLLARAAVFAER